MMVLEVLKWAEVAVAVLLALLASVCFLLLENNRPEGKGKP